jgi:thioredoxin-related protein
MSKRFLVPVIVVLMLSAAGLFAQSISWRADLNTAVAEAKKSGKMLMIDVYTDWCTWCKRLDSDTYSDKKVIAGAASFVALKINPETSTDGAKYVNTYGVSGYPTILFVEADGTLANKIVGYLDAPSFYAAMTKTTEYAPKVKRYLAELNAGTYGNARALLTMLVELGRIDEARKVFDKVRTTVSLEPSVQESVALSIAQYYVDDSQYDEALVYLKIVESFSSGSDNARDACLLHSIAVFYTRGKVEGMGYLDALLKDPKTPFAWRQPIQDLKDRMKAAKDPGSS